MTEEEKISIREHLIDWIDHFLEAGITPQVVNPEAIRTNYIPKSKIREKMKKYEWALTSYDCYTADYKHSQAIGRFIGLQELLEEEV